MLVFVMFALFVGLPVTVIAWIARLANPRLPHPVVTGTHVEPVPFETGRVLAGAYLDSTPQFATPAPVVEALADAQVVRPFDHAGGPLYVHPSLTRMFAQHDAAAPAVPAQVTPAPYKTASKARQHEQREASKLARKARNRAVAEIMRVLSVAITPESWALFHDIARSLDWDASDDAAVNAELFAHAYDAKFGHVHVDEPQDVALTSWQRTRETRKQAGLTVRGTEPRTVCEGHVRTHWSDDARPCKRLARDGSRFCCDKHAENYARS